MDIAKAILGVFGIVSDGVSRAIEAAIANKEEEAFSILFDTLTEGASAVSAMRVQVAKNKADAEKALAEKFASTADEPTKP